MEDKTIKFGKNLVTTKEVLAPGHSFCTGCGEVSALRLALKALGDDIIIANVTGCIEIKNGVVHWIVGTGDHGVMSGDGCGIIFGNSF